MTWAPVTINKKVGTGLENNEDDVKKIQALLNLLRIGPRLEVNGQCDKDTIAAIGNFQKIWGQNPDYLITPGGKTLQLLNDTAKPLTLIGIKLINVLKGGYEITYQGFVPPKGYKVMLYFPASFSQIPSDAIDITSQGLENKEAKIPLNIKDTLPQLLKLIERKGVWGSVLAFNVSLVRDDGYVVSVSNQIYIKTPVKPYEGPIRLNMQRSDPPMYYVGVGLGRYFSPPIENKRYFCYGSIFEVDPEKRGFDCTTYAGTILGLDGFKRQLGGTGKDLAELANAEKCEFEFMPGQTKVMENITFRMLKYFFTNNSSGSYIVWKLELNGEGKVIAGHVVLVIDSVVHEYNLPVGRPGYKTCKVLEWRKLDRTDSNVWNIRRIKTVA